VVERVLRVSQPLPELGAAVALLDQLRERITQTAAPDSTQGSLEDPSATL